MKHSPCIRSGWCCKKSVCPFGAAVSQDNPRCRFLSGDRLGDYSCDKYDEIISGMPNNAAHISPAFGAGCCATLNSDRIKMGYRPSFKLDDI